MATLTPTERNLRASIAAKSEREMKLVRADAVTVERTTFLHDPLIPLRSVTMIVGEPGLAKTTLGITWLASITVGTLPGALLGTPRDVVIWSGEDSIASTLVPRLMVAGADLHRVHFVTVTDDLGVETGLSLPGDLALLEAKVREVDAVAVFVDPLMAALGDSIDSHNDHGIRRALAPMFRLANTLGNFR